MEHSDMTCFTPYAKRPSKVAHFYNLSVTLTNSGFRDRSNNRRLKAILSAQE
ncbi:hypothetical protein ALO54_101741 [Pseudomonas syringae pv. philadelphi]|uniref:Uncharacterized protein n=1 Tax=Pseudomonas syringae pv. viburni TaxID=251703 RepID=A0A0Q0EXJ3_9PSED|nr:hypothetical protein ALO86_101548 [Pseudomonas syringae pv. berberidis]KPY23495.1 hypothetical protein ALO54_101741 [Pseudomonas syringae pv. philadelphi]KPZ14991.1 hypothetical protein ALO40_102021 [Pseudomonas syringae pv. viburni]RMM35599.1 hypothetical protein ALQ83_101794 [Pseudomonas syringae pv. berberidis]RMP65943.1 hypothetical protein ALQ19_101812 [Pseudomonas syringae pv. berberidis]